MISTTLIALAAVCGGVWYWHASMRAKEIANAKAKELCEEAAVQLLDQSVTLKKMRFRRDESGRMAFERTYDFDYAIDEKTRFRGQIVVHGNQVGDAHLNEVSGVRRINKVDLNPIQTEQKPADVIDFKQFQTPANDQQKED